VFEGDGVDVALGAFAQIGMPGEETAEASIGIFDPAFFPGAMRIAEVGFDAECIAQFVMVGELRTIVLRKRAAELNWQGDEPGVQLLGGWRGLTG